MRFWICGSISDGRHRTYSRFLKNRSASLIGLLTMPVDSLHHNVQAMAVFALTLRSPSHLTLAKFIKPDARNLCINSPRSSLIELRIGSPFRVKKQYASFLI